MIVLLLLNLEVFSKSMLNDLKKKKACSALDKIKTPIGGDEWASPPPKQCFKT